MMEVPSKKIGSLSGEWQIASNIFKGSLGNMIEWFDWYVYASFSIYFSAAFFPASNQTAELLSTAAVFAIGFLMRPLGSLIMGQFADKKGRKAALTLSVTIMAAGSLIIAFAPTYAQVGIISPIILVVTRMVQGLSLGGEYGTSATYMSEMASRGRRGFYSSFQYVTLIAGQLFSLLVQIILQQILTDDQLYAFGWRIPFIIGALGAIVVGMTLGGTISFYSYTTYMQQFMINSAGMDKETVALINFLVLLIMVALQPLFGHMSDKIGRRPLLIFFGIGGTLLTVPLFTLLAHVSTALQAFLLMLTGVVIVSGYTSINAIVKAELFPSEIRALGVGLPYGLTVALFGGTSQYVALYMRSIGHESLFFYYVSFAAFISLLVYVFALKGHRSALDDEA